MNKGIIMEVKKNYAIALNDEGIMDKILPKDNMEVGQKIFYFESDIIKTTTNKVYRYNNFMKAIGSIAALFLIVFTFFHTMKPEAAYAVVSLDINPSIQIEVDSKQKIIKVEGVNADGKNIDFSDVKDISLDNGIQKIKEKLVEKNYLDTNKEVLVGFAFVQNGDNTNYEESIKDAIQSTFNTEKVTYVKGDKDDVDEAKTKGISLGRYEASLVVDEETKNKIDKAPVKEITASIKDKENVTQWEAQDEKANEAPAITNTNSSSDIKEEKPVSEKPATEQGTTEKPVINAPSDNAGSNIDSGKTKDNTAKTENNDGILELDPEVPAQAPTQNDKTNSSNTSNSSSDNTIIIEPNNGTIENNTTSGKVQEDSNKVSIEPSKAEDTSVGSVTKN